MLNSNFIQTTSYLISLQQQTHVLTLDFSPRLQWKQEPQGMMKVQATLPPKGSLKEWFGGIEQVDTCWYMLIYVDMCWYMLIDICWCCLGIYIYISLYVDFVKVNYHITGKKKKKHNHWILLDVCLFRQSRNEHTEPVFCWWEFRSMSL